jgi:hypothetical protein
MTWSHFTAFLLPSCYSPVGTLLRCYPFCCVNHLNLVILLLCLSCNRCSCMRSPWTTWWRFAALASCHILI